MSEERCAGGKEGRLEKNTPVLARNGHLDGLYRLIRHYWNLQELFSYASPEAKIKQLEMEIARLKEKNVQLKGS